MLGIEFLIAQLALDDPGDRVGAQETQSQFFLDT